MSKKIGTSIVPLVMGIIGAVIQLPGAVCSGMCAAGVSSLAENSSSDSGELGANYMLIGLVAALIGFIGGILGKKKPTASGILLLLATLMSGVTLITFNFFSLIAVILFLIGGIFAFVQKKEVVEV